MLKRLIPAIAVLCLATGAQAEPKPPACQHLADSVKQATELAEKEGLGFTTIDGAQAKVFLNEINNVGEPTTFSAEHRGEDHDRSSSGCGA